MKKIKVFFSILVTTVILANCSTVYASEEEMVITGGELQIRELSRSEMELLESEMDAEAITGGASEPMATTASYTAYEYSRRFNFTLNGTWVAHADAVCVVWHYTDGKVHLYERSITVTRLATYDAGRTYGSIVNTDGSLSYTTGDRVHLYSVTNSWDFALDFRVTPTEASFNCYEV